MLTSARNELNGTITEIKSGGVMSEVIVKITDAISIASTITNNSKERLSLQIGEAVSLLIKSSFVILSKEELRTSARNNIKAKVTEVIKGAVNGEIKLALGANTLCSIITNDAIESLGIKTGDDVYAIFKASSVIIVAK